MPLTTRPLTYLSVCSGIEAATVAWHPLGWRPFGFAEIEAFPSAVLAHHYGSNLPGEAYARNGVPNFGDMTKFKEWPDADVDVLVGGTPCQSFSVAGLRKGLADPRGNLALVYLGIADRYRPEWIVWENVPGVLSSSEGRDFGAFIGGLAELGYHAAWRVLDAQYVRVDGFGRAVPQRRRRVFVVGHSGSWRRAAAVFLEPESMSGNPAPRRQAGKGVAPTISSRPTGGGGLGTDFDCDGGLIPQILHCLNAGGMGRQDYETKTETVIAHALRADGFDASEDGTGRGTPIVPVVAASLTRGAESSGKGGYAGRRQEDDVNIVAIQERAVSENAANGPDGAGIRTDGAAYTIEARSVPQAVAFAIGSHAGAADGDQTNRSHAKGGPVGSNISEELAYSLRSEGPGQRVAHGWAVRRLMPIECERLQGFPDGYTDIPYRNKPAADGPRYKALGNSMAVNVMRWIGRRIDLVRSIAEAA